MVDSYAELLVKRKNPPFMFFIKAAAVLFSIALSFCCVVFIPAVGFIIALVPFVLLYFFMRNTSIEYEYIYISGELAIDKIVSKSTRKKAERINLERMDLIAPYESHKLDYYKEGKVRQKDYSSGGDTKKAYGMIYSDSGNTVLIKFEPDEKLLKEMRLFAPSRVNT